MSIPPPETQSQRWVKYGGNVALTSLVVILLAAGGVYIAQRHPKRIDTTVSGINSLKPQTVSVLNGLKSKVRLISLYATPETKGKTGADLQTAEEAQRQTEMVSDLLQEYAKRSSNVSVDFIDPQREQTKLDDLVKDVTNKYASELKPYKDFLEVGYPKFVGDFKAFAAPQALKVAKFPTTGITQDQAISLAVLKATVEDLVPRLDKAQESIESYLKKSVPDYRGAADRVQSALGIFDQLLSKVTEDLKAAAGDAGTPAILKQYAAENLPEFEKAQKQVKEQLDAADKLPPLKLDALRESIKRQSILVLADDEARVLGFGDVWKAPDDLRSMLSTKDKPRLKFAGEQQVSTAILSITRKKKPLVIFVRPAGPPLTQSFMRQAQCSAIADRLRDADYEVAEKDLSGQFAMQAMQSGMPVQEATEAQMKDRSAVWVVFSLVGPMSQMGPDPIPGKLKEHLDEGGSALVLVEPERDACDEALRDFGIRIRTDAIVVKESSGDTAAIDSGDMVDQASRMSYIFMTNQYGDSPLTKPVGALSSLLLPLAPVEYTEAQGRKGMPLLPITREVKTWGETTIGPVIENTAPTFDPAKDIANTKEAPMYAGVAVEKGNSRVVALGTTTSFSNGIMSIPDPEFEKRGLLTARFPGNSELFLNSVFWLSKNDTMLAISPAAMEVSRIGVVSEGQMKMLQFGLLGGLPAAVLVVGVLVYMSRRD